MNMDQKNIRNFCIIAHIDHGKSTIADRMLEITGTVAKREMQEQLLDQMDLEKERGITIKLAPVRMVWSKEQGVSGINHPTPNSQPPTSSEFILNLIDTPGHVDFSYEVSRSLAAVEGAVLLVDASQGIEAQTLSNLYAAIDHDLEIIPVVNKIDLPAARPDEVAEEIVKILGCKKEDIIYASGKTGEGVEEILSAIVKRVPSPDKNPNYNPPAGGQISNPPAGEAGKYSNDQLNNDEINDHWKMKNDNSESRTGEREPLRALIFDSIYDSYRGVVSYVRIVNGKFEKGDKFFLMETKSEGEAIEVGYFTPKLKAHTPLSVGEIGYIVTGFRGVSEARVGDTITLEKNPASTPLPGYKTVQPSVFASIYCVDGGDYPELKVAIEKLKMNDSSLSYEVEQSPALGFGFRCGFLGLLHLDIVKERLEREYNLALVISSPTVRYEITKNDHSEELIVKPSDLPSSGEYIEIREPWVKLEVFTPKEYIGGIMEVVQNKRAIYQTTEFLDESRVIINYEIPLAEVIIDLYDSLKSISRGYASMNYELIGYREADLEKVDILVSEEKVDALSFIIHKSKTLSEGRRITEKLKKLIPRQNFEIKIQAAIGAKIIASERISPFRKDVTSGLYGGDVTRKNKLLDKQKKGKKKMKQIGRVEMPTDVFIKVLRNE